MSQCEVKVGFFTLGQCEKTSTGKCSQCKQAACVSHFVAEQSLCIVCAASAHIKSNEIAEKKTADKQPANMTNKKPIDESNFIDPYQGFGVREDCQKNAEWYQKRMDEKGYNSTFTAQDLVAFELTQPAEGDDDEPLFGGIYDS